MSKIFEKIDSVLNLLIVPIGVALLFCQIYDGRYVNALFSILILIIFFILNDYRQNKKI